MGSPESACSLSLRPARHDRCGIPDGVGVIANFFLHVAESLSLQPLPVEKFVISERVTHIEPRCSRGGSVPNISDIPLRRLVF